MDLNQKIIAALLAGFFLIALLGGAAGGILGMYAFRHKTRHWYFKWGLPAILLLQLAGEVLRLYAVYKNTPAIK